MVCARWDDSKTGFKAFVADMGLRPPGRTLDRKNNDLGYSPDNCRWATLSEQGRNKRGTRLITFNEKTQCLAAWAEELGVSTGCLYQRLKTQLPEQAMTGPRKRKRLAQAL